MEQNNVFIQQLQKRISKQPTLIRSSVQKRQIKEIFSIV
jgi:hypothetical protein